MPTPSPYCETDEPHHEHEVYGPEGQEDMCPGAYPLIESFGQWKLEGDSDVGFWLASDEPAPPYEIPKERVHESDWERHMSEKTWVDIGSFRTALASARSRWPR